MQRRQESTDCFPPVAIQGMGNFMDCDVQAFLRRADELRPELRHMCLPARDIVEPVPDSTAFQRIRMNRISDAAVVSERGFRNGDKMIFDFGETAVGRIRINLDTTHGYADSPVRLLVIAGEFPLEMTESPDTFHGTLSRAWIQDEIVNIDDLPREFTMPRRVSCRYVSIEVIATPGELRIRGCSLEMEGAELSIPETERAIDLACFRTLRNCMQTVMEDGPKRDRRLWTGDLRLQALVNDISFKRYDLVERSLLLIAGCPNPEGLLPGCVFERPYPIPGCNVLDYSLIFSVVLEEHCRFSGNRELGRMLYQTAKRQFDFFRRYVTNDLFQAAKTTPWVFIDHFKELERDAAMQCTAIWAIKHLASLAEKLGKNADAMEMRTEAASWKCAARTAWYDSEEGMLVCGKRRQISYASQIWAVLAGVLTREEGRSALTKVQAMKNAVKPVSPYLVHYLGEAMLTVGMHEETDRLVKAYWGQMIAKGADTFWEVYSEDDDYYTPYGDARLNSGCHAWSGTACVLLGNRKKQSREKHATEHID